MRTQTKTMTPPPKTTPTEDQREKATRKTTLPYLSLVLVFSFSDAATKRTDPNSGKICRSKTDYDDDDDLE
tara:strand:- start:547 stop:759 length:213 start_codon:yes stop_codon:yes gene_type:complete